MSPAVREMTLRDCDRVAALRVRGWQTAYRGLIPDAYLDAMSVAEDAEWHRARFTQGDGSVVDLVAETAGKVVGWAWHGPYRDGEKRTADAELYALYVDSEHLGNGTGRALLQESLRRTSGLGHTRMYLWVLKGNTRARRFYARAGFRTDGAEQPFEVGGVVVSEVRYVRHLTGVTAQRSQARVPG